MNIVALTVALVIVVIGVVSQRIRPPQPSEPIGDTDVLSDNDSTATPSATQEVPTGTQSPTFTITPSPQPTTTTTPSNDLNSLQYPGSSVVNSSDSALTLTSGDSPDAITQWYKAAIVARHMNVKSFVTTKANEKVHNVLVGVGDGEIRVTITRDSDDDQTSIVVERS